MVECPSCRTVVPPEARVCPKCGSVFSARDRPVPRTIARHVTVVIVVAGLVGAGLALVLH